MRRIIKPSGEKNNRFIKSGEKIFPTLFPFSERKIKDKLQIRPYVQKEINRLTSLIPTLLEQIEYWLVTGKVAASKIISLHKLIPSVISKGKIGKTAEIGRKVIINQYTGGFLQVFIPKKSNPSDQKILKESIQGATRTFKEKIESIGADRGFSSEGNIKRCRRYHIKKIGIQPKGQGEWEVDREMARELYCRRAAINALQFGFPCFARVNQCLSSIYRRSRYHHLRQI